MGFPLVTDRSLASHLDFYFFQGNPLLLSNRSDGHGDAASQGRGDQFHRTNILPGRIVPPIDFDETVTDLDFCMVLECDI